MNNNKEKEYLDKNKKVNDIKELNRDKEKKKKSKKYNDTKYNNNLEECDKKKFHAIINSQYVIFLRKDHIDNGKILSEGLNIETSHFSKKMGGIYFYSLHNCLTFLNDSHFYMYSVLIPENSVVLEISSGFFKSNIIQLKNRITLKYFIENISYLHQPLIGYNYLERYIKRNYFTVERIIQSQGIKHDIDFNDQTFYLFDSKYMIYKNVINYVNQINQIEDDRVRLINTDPWIITYISQWNNKLLKLKYYSKYIINDLNPVTVNVLKIVDTLYNSCQYFKLLSFEIFGIFGQFFEILNLCNYLPIEKIDVIYILFEYTCKKIIDQTIIQYYQDEINKLTVILIKFYEKYFYCTKNDLIENLRNSSNISVRVYDIESKIDFTINKQLYLLITSKEKILTKEIIDTLEMLHIDNYPTTRENFCEKSNYEILLSVLKSIL